MSRGSCSPTPGRRIGKPRTCCPQVFPDLEEQGAAAEKALAAKDPEAAAQAGLVNHMRMIFYSPRKRDAYIAHMGDLGFVPAVSKRRAAGDGGP